MPEQYPVTIDQPQNYVGLHHQQSTEGLSLEAAKNLQDFRAQAEAHLPGIKDKWLVYTHSVLGVDAPDNLDARLNGTTQVLVDYGVKEGDGRFRDRQVVVAEPSYNVASASPDAFKSFLGHTLAHEVGHGLFTAASQEGFIRGQNRIVRNGINVTAVEGDPTNLFAKSEKVGIWLNEATLEHHRQMCFETKDISYEPAVALLRTMSRLAPGLDNRLLSAAVSAEGPAKSFGEVETILGPTGIEEAELMMRGMSRASQLPEFIRKVSTLFSEKVRDQAVTGLVEEINIIFKDKPFDFAPLDAREFSKLPEERIAVVLEKIGLTDASPDERLDMLEEVSVEQMVYGLVALHNYLVPEGQVGPITGQHSMSSGELLAKPEDRLPIMEAAFKLSKDLIRAYKIAGGDPKNVLERIANLTAFSLLMAHPFKDGNGRTARTIAHAIRFGYNKNADAANDLRIVSNERPETGFRHNSYTPRTGNTLPSEDPIGFLGVLAASSIAFDQEKYHGAIQGMITTPYEQP